MPERVSTSPGFGLRALLVLPLVAAWVALLVVPGLQPAWLARSLVARFAPLGFLAVFVFPDRGLRTTRVLLVATPAFVLGAAAAAVALGWRTGDAGLPGPSDVLPPALAVAFGVVVALAWRRGPFAVLLLPLKLAFLALLVLVLGAGFLFTQAQREPAVPVPAPVTAEEKQQLVTLLQGLDPWALAAGEVRQVRLASRQVERLAAWLLPRVVSPQRARVALVVTPHDELEVLSALPLPLGRWLNSSASAGVSVERGRLELRQLRLRLGRIALPRALADPLAPLLAAVLGAERPLRPVLAAVREGHVERGAVVLSYGRIEGPRGPVGELLWGRSAPNGGSLPEAAPTPRPMVERAPGAPVRR
jgi:hypothetical protein